MKEPEKTFFSMRNLHLWFVISSIVFLATTVWMIADDHLRPWKRFQKQYESRFRPDWLRIESMQEEVARSASETSSRQDGDHADPVDFSEIIARVEQNVPAPKARFDVPLLDAWLSPVSIHQQWLPGLPLDYHFGPVQRLDRCRTCHLGVVRQLPPDPAVWRYWDAPKNAPLLRKKRLPMKLVPERQRGETPLVEEAIHGLVLVPEQLSAAKTPTVGAVLPGSAASKAGFLPGDRILTINADRPEHSQEALSLLRSPPALPASVTYPELISESISESISEKEENAIYIEISRGRPAPLATHPRQDLFVGAESPHPVDRFGCTICHGGQPLATDMSRAAHVPNSSAQAEQWENEYKWSFDHHAPESMVPRRFLESRCLSCHVEVTALEEDEALAPPPARKLVAGYKLVRRYGCFGCHRIDGYNTQGERVGVDLRLEPSSGDRSPTTKGKEIPGQMRKIGPPLRSLAARMNSEDIIRWTENPQSVVEGAKMPRFFGLDDHLSPQERGMAKRREAVELKAIAEYLLGRSEPLPAADSAQDDSELVAPSATRGRYFFQSLGCTACHRHDAFPAIATFQGGDLSRLDRRLTGPEARRWVAEWIRRPRRFSPRTLMPNMLIAPQKVDFLVPTEGLPEDQGEPPLCDPVRDITEFLFRESEPLPASAGIEFDPESRDSLGIAYLSLTRPQHAAAELWRNGFPEDGEQKPVGAEAILSAPLTEEKRWQYLGKETLLRRGCFGCHDLPQMIEATEIGPELTGWSDKHPSLLGFESVENFLLDEKGTEASAEPDHDFCMQAIVDKRPMGFLWQKLRRPRSFDYRLAGEKGYLDWLRMGRFDFTARQREQIMTFVLGLRSDPPPEPYRDVPEGNRMAIAQGRELLDRYGCDGCHIRSMGRWEFTLRAEDFELPPELPAYDFMKPEVSPEAVENSLEEDLRGTNTATITGRAMHDETGQVVLDEDWDGNPLLFITPWKPAVIGGEIWPIGEISIPVSEPSIDRRRFPVGGSAARELYPVVVDRALTSGTSGSFHEAWGWLPPPLVREGRMIRPDWLFQYLLEPTVIRPASVMRMPQFYLSESEAARLVRYFSAVDELETPFPVESVLKDSENDSDGDLEKVDARTLVDRPNRMKRLDQAFALVRDQTTYCMKCHIVGPLEPEGGNPTVLAPDLAGVAGRVRPRALRRWIANPKAVLPYTAMPVNFPPEQEMGQEILPGTSFRQLDAVCDLLLNFHAYLAARELGSSAEASDRKNDGAP